MILLSDPQIAAIASADNGEPLVDVRDVPELRWDTRLADEAGAFAMLREGVLQRLLTAQSALPYGFRLLVVEGYRPATLQRQYFEEYQDELAMLTHISTVGLEPGEGAAGAIACPAPSPAAELEKAQTLQLLALALKTLVERDAQILSLYYNEDFTYAEIGELLGVTESRVCQLHGRALARLRDAVVRMEERNG